MLRRAIAAVKTLLETENSVSIYEDVAGMDKARASIPARIGNALVPSFSHNSRRLVEFCTSSRPPCA